MAEAQHPFRHGRVAVAPQEQRDQRAAEAQQHDKRDGQQRRRLHELDAEGVAQALDIARSIKLRAENARARQTAEHAQIEHKHQLIGNGHA